jgi:two-component system chemotaxis response regulator CheB
MNEATRVLVVDDSPFVCRLLADHLSSAPGVAVAGKALDGAQAVTLIRELRPDAVTLDLEMPEMNGLQVLERVMRECPTPVVVVSGVSRRAAAATLQALELGAVDFVLKYTAGSDTDPDLFRQEVVSKVRIAARVKVIRSLPGARTTAPELRRAAPGADAVPHWLTHPIVVIGASTGGPLALRELLGRLPTDFPAALVVVQHMPAHFTRVLATQLDRQVPLVVREAEDGACLQAGQVLVAPGDRHLLIRGNSRVELVRGPRIGGHCPSIDVTMQSAAQVCGPRASGVVLTGMGSDGALGLMAIHARGGRTFAQDAASCVVNGMPQQAIDRGVVDHVGSPCAIAELLTLTLEKRRW